MHRTNYFRSVFIFLLYFQIELLVCGSDLSDFIKTTDNHSNCLIDFEYLLLSDFPLGQLVRLDC